MKNKENKYKKGILILKLLDRSIRLLIAECLLVKEKCVNNIQKGIISVHPNISQHCSPLTFSRIGDFQPKGNLCCYFLVDSGKTKNT